MKTKHTIAALVVTLCLLVIGIAYVATRESAAASSSTHAESACVSSQSEQCPSTDFLHQYDQWIQLGSDIHRETESDAVRSLQAKQDQWRGMQERLVQAVPQGYDFDTSKKKFVMKIAVPQASQPTPPPPPTAK